jgi:hypothetical protein
MSYRCGIGARFGLAMGVDASEPVIICDVCGIRRPVASKTSYAPAWFLDGKPPPKWRGRRWTDDEGNPRREDFCPACKAKEVQL